MPKAKLPCVVIVGRPNVGKSSLFNRIVGRRVAVVEAQPGITRDRLYQEAEWNGRRFEVVDTGGILFSDDDPLVEQIRVQAEIALQEADVVLFLGDAVDGVLPADEELAEALRGIEKPVLVAVNKADNPERDTWISEFYALGLGDVFAVSALHGRGVADLLDRVVGYFPESDDEQAEDDERVRIAIVGRPNVGKSSLLNAFAGEQRAIVSDVPGTTRDAIDTEIEFKGERILLVDTAGIRRRGKIQGSVEYYMVMRAEKAMARADVAMIVVDGNEGLTDGDKRIGKAAHDLGKACVIVVNKWDLVEPPDGRPTKRSKLKTDFAKKVHEDFPDLAYAPIAYTSASCGSGLDAALETALEAVENHNFRVPTGALNKIVREAVFARPYSRKGRILKVYYATQVSTAPPKFVLFVNDPDLVHFSYQRYLENKIRNQFPLEGTPIKLEFRSSHESRHKPT